MIFCIMDTAVWLLSGYWLGAIVWVAMFNACTFIIIDTPCFLRQKLYCIGKDGKEKRSDWLQTLDWS
jgi:hypothetical protein